MRAAAAASAADSASEERLLPLAPWLLVALALLVFLEPLYANLVSRQPAASGINRVNGVNSKGAAT